ncbi:hypothetical protein XU18_3094 [Perkinsela sp. CCAP 1560/4]|nr:hypothetical protein XU18_3094 [Perkinsela sp. CCAP 1560/4]|eukprot:KNH05932.1 hypothetical protein XU18_3094 [Perkinsela sp. CCAP 1560/4]
MLAKFTQNKALGCSNHRETESHMCYMSMNETFIPCMLKPRCVNDSGNFNYVVDRAVHRGVSRDGGPSFAISLDGFKLYRIGECTLVYQSTAAALQGAFLALKVSF